MLNEDHIQYITENSNANINALLLKGIPFQDVEANFIIQQIQARQHVIKKLPSWVAENQVVFPPKLNLAQSSSEITANYKSKIISNSKVADLTGGFGIDAFALSKTNHHLDYIEENGLLHEIVKHNAKVFKIQNLSFYNTTAEDFIISLKEKLDWMYIDPSRRDTYKKRVFLLEDCTPNILELLPHLKHKCDFLLVKTSPLIDISYGIKALKYVKNIHVIAIENDLKELLWELDFSVENNFPNIKTVQFKKNNALYFEVETQIDKHNVAYSLPLQYLYEPNSALMKVGLFNQLAEQFQLKKLHPNSHLFTSNQEIENFPGRSFIVENCEEYKPKVLKKRWKGEKMNISTRNFPIVAKDLINILKTKDGGKKFVFFTTDINHQKIVLSCLKIH